MDNTRLNRDHLRIIVKQAMHQSAFYKKMVDVRDYAKIQRLSAIDLDRLRTK